MSGIARWVRRAASSRPHGTRSRYVAGCRCPKCRAANAAYANARDAQRKAEALERAAAAPPVPAPGQVRAYAKNGWIHRRHYARSCPGLSSEGCAFGSYLRKDSVGGICARCRHAHGFKGNVSSAAAREHILKLRAAGVGRRAIADACDVSATAIQLIGRGKKPLIRASVARRILAVDKHAAAGAALVPSGRTWQRIDWLLSEGFTKAELARRLGWKTPAIQLKRGRPVLAATAVKVEKFYRLIRAGA